MSVEQYKIETFFGDASIFTFIYFSTKLTLLPWYFHIFFERSVKNIRTFNHWNEISELNMRFTLIMRKKSNLNIQDFTLQWPLFWELLYHFGPNYGQVLLINQAEKQKVVKADTKYETELTYHLIIYSIVVSPVRLEFLTLWFLTVLGKPLAAWKASFELVFHIFTIFLSFFHFKLFANILDFLFLTNSI